MLGNSILSYGSVVHGPSIARWTVRCGGSVNSPATLPDVRLDDNCRTKNFSRPNVTHPCDERRFRPAFRSRAKASEPPRAGKFASHSVIPCAAGQKAYVHDKVAGSDRPIPGRRELPIGEITRFRKSLAHPLLLIYCSTIIRWGRRKKLGQCLVDLRFRHRMSVVPQPGRQPIPVSTGKH